MLLQSINPATETVIATYPALSTVDIQQIISAAQAEFTIWRSSSFTRRSELMHQAAIILRENKVELGKLITTEMGKILSEAVAEVEKCAWVCDYYADNAESFLQPENISTEMSESFVAFQPIGIVLAVMPWNFPFWQVFRFAAPAL